MTIHKNKLFVPNMVQHIDGNRAEHDFSIEALGDINIFVGEDSDVLAGLFPYFRQIRKGCTIELFCSAVHPSRVHNAFDELIIYVKDGAQVFISTQSLDVVYYVMDTYGGLCTIEPDLDIKFIWVGKSVKEGDNKKLISVIYGRDEFEACLRMGIDVRGGNLPYTRGSRDD